MVGIDLDLLKVVKGLMKDSEVVYLSTIGLDGGPQIRAMLNLRNEKMFPRLIGIWDTEEPFSILVITDTSSNKVKEMEKDRRVSVYFCAPGRRQGIMIACEAEIIHDLDYKKMIWQEDWVRYYPHGPTDPEFALLRLRPRHAKGWKGDGNFEMTIEE